MKQLFLIAILVLTGMAANAQYIYNNPQCPLEYRRFCIDQQCNKNYPGGSWAALPPAPGITPIAGSFCAAGEIDGFEVRYDATVPPFCSGSVEVINPSGYGLCSLMTMGHLGKCEDCNRNPEGVFVDYNGLNVHISD